MREERYEQERRVAVGHDLCAAMGHLASTGHRQADRPTLQSLILSDRAC
jgi:hypothetical protein